MPVYEYTGLDARGRRRQGIIDADGPRAARLKLTREGVFLTGLSETNAAAPSRRREINLARYLGRVSQADVAIVTRLLSNLIGAGISVVESLTAVIDQVEKEKLKTVLTQIKNTVNEGSSLSDAMAAHPRIFTKLYTNMIAAGESSGSLEIVTERLADFLESQEELRGKISGAMMYPAIVLGIAVIIVGILFTVVVPKVTGMFADIKVTLPLATRLLIAVSDLVSGFWWLLALGLIGGSVAFSRWRASERGRLAWDRMMLKAPLIGDIVRMIAVSRFSRTLSTLLASGVPLLTSMDIVKNILNNSVLVSVLEAARDDIREGESIADPLKRSREFPPIVTHMIAIGERTGQLEEMLNHVSRIYDAQVNRRVNALVSLLEPVMIVGMALVVVFIVFSILMPILKINEAVGL